MEENPAILISSSKKINKLLGWVPKYPNINQIVLHAYNWHIKKLNEKFSF